MFRRSTLAQTAVGYSPLFCCCKEPAPVPDNAGGSQFAEEPAPARPPGINPFLRLRSRDTDGAADDSVNSQSVSVFTDTQPGYVPDAVDAQLSEQFARIELAARQAISEKLSTLPKAELQSLLDISEGEAMAALLALGIFDDDCCC